MAEIVLIYGKSGSGKSRSLKNFAEDEILLVNVERKRLPFKKQFKYVLNTDDYRKIMEQLAKMPLKTAVIDDAGYLLSNNFMKGHSLGRKGREVYDLYNDLADSFWGIFKFIKTKLPQDTIVYILMHEDSDETGNMKLKTIGKLLDDKVCLEGMVTICLRCMSVDGRHFFRTVTDGSDITKSPEEMFESEIENDLKAVDTIIREYYGFGGNNSD
jgi:hypothetical protein